MTKWEQHNQRLNDMGWLLPADMYAKRAQELTLLHFRTTLIPMLKRLNPNLLVNDLLSVQPMPDDIFLEPMWDGNGSMRAMSLVYRPQ